MTGGNNGDVKFWDIRTLKNFTFKQSNSAITALASANLDESTTSHFASGGADGKIVIWSHQPKFVHHGH